MQKVAQIDDVAQKLVEAYKEVLEILNAYRIVYRYLFFHRYQDVATSIRTLKTQLEKMGHTVFIFTTTDRDVDRYEDWQIVRIPSVPFFAF